IEGNDTDYRRLRVMVWHCRETAIWRYIPVSHYCRTPSSAREFPTLAAQRVQFIKNELILFRETQDTSRPGLLATTEIYHALSSRKRFRRAAVHRHAH